MKTTNTAPLCDPAPTVLVVDDDPMVRGVETKILRSQGYTVLEASSAIDALRVAKEVAAIDLLITDYSMPEIDGLELARRFRTSYPQTPVLMVSGSLPLLRGGNEDLDRVELLAKPFAFEDLLSKVRDLLEAAFPFPRRKQWCCD